MDVLGARICAVGVCVSCAPPPPPQAFALNVVKEQYAAWQALYARDPKAARADGAAYAEFWWAHQPTLRRSVRMA